MKFQPGDIVTPVKKSPLGVKISSTKRKWGYNNHMQKLMEEGVNIVVEDVGMDYWVRAGTWSWHEEDLELVILNLENK